MNDNVSKFCKTEGCGRIRLRGRGCCGACYLRLRKMVLRKEATWEQLETEGKCLPAQEKKEFKMVKTPYKKNLYDRMI